MQGHLTSPFGVSAATAMVSKKTTGMKNVRAIRQATRGGANAVIPRSSLPQMTTATSLEDRARAAGWTPGQGPPGQVQQSTPDPGTQQGSAWWEMPPDDSTQMVDVNGDPADAGFQTTWPAWKWALSITMLGLVSYGGYRIYKRTRGRK